MPYTLHVRTNRIGENEEIPLTELLEGEPYFDLERSEMFVGTNLTITDGNEAIKITDVFFVDELPEEGITEKLYIHKTNGTLHFYNGSTFIQVGGGASTGGGLLKAVVDTIEAADKALPIGSVVSVRSDSGRLYELVETITDIKPNMTSNKTADFEAFGSSERTSFHFYMAFDGNTSSKTSQCWLAGVNDKTPHLGLKDSEPKEWESFTLMARPVNGWGVGVPTHFKLLGSNDGEDYTLIQEYQHEPFTDGETREFMIDKGNRGSYQYHKIEMINNAADKSGWNIMEWIPRIVKRSYEKVGM